MALYFFAVAIGLVAGGLPAGAVETPVGSKNFTAPRYVPNYFSNESGAFTGARGAGTETSTAPRAYAPSPHSYVAASHRVGHSHRYASSRRHYYHAAHHAVAGHRHAGEVAARGHRHSQHAGPTAGHHRAVRVHARSASRPGRIARAGG